MFTKHADNRQLSTGLFVMPVNPSPICGSSVLRGYEAKQEWSHAGVVV